MQEREYLNLGEKIWKNPVQMDMHKRGLFNMFNIIVGCVRVCFNFVLTVLALHPARQVSVGMPL
jgi:hypothetical protein